MTAGCVIVTRGDRPRELARAVSSAAEQTEPLDVLVVANGAPAEVSPQARLLRLDENAGPPGARNRAIPEVKGDVLFFLDDDAAFADPELVAQTLRRFVADRSLGIVSFRVADPEGRPAQRRHVPRLRASDPERSSDVTTFLEGACAIRRTVFERAGLYAEEFGFGHEGTDLAWRALDAGFRIAYAGDLVVHHPALPPERHETFHYLSARNRVFLARRRLPVAIAIVHVLVWLALDLARAERARAEVARGYRDGVRMPCGTRKPIRWRTVWRMTLLGRPPLL